MAETDDFRELEHQGWHAKAESYDALAGRITGLAAEPLLEAIGVSPGISLLDVASGPGYIAAAAAGRGARVIGVDFAAGMVETARRRYPAIDFREGDAENLAFPTAAFDAVVCGFGLLHLADPDRGIAEAWRVLKPGGRYAFTVWAGTDRHQFFQIVLKAVHDHGDMNVPLPPAPPTFRFADASECRRALAEAGFAGVSVTHVPLSMRVSAPGDVLDFIYRTTVRTAMILERQTAEARARIHEAIEQALAPLARPGGYDIGWTAVLVAARKPGGSIG